MMKQAPRGQDAAPDKHMRNALCPCGSGAKYKRCCGSASGQPKAPGAIGTRTDPRAAREQFLRGAQLLRSGQTTAAISILLAAIQSDENHFDAYHALGSALAQNGQFAEASAILSRAVSLRPDSAAAHRDLGAAYDCQDLHEQAIAAYRRAVELKPALGEVSQRLGELYLLYSRNEEAADCFDRAADALRNTTQARLYRSYAELLRGNIPAAEQWARKAVALEPASDAAHGTVAGLLYAQGRFEEAAASFETALRRNPKAAKCWDGLAHCRKYSETDNSILDRMRAALQRGDVNDPERTTIHFAMGKVYEDCDDYAHAMEQFDMANRLRAKDLKFDRAGFAAQVDRNIQYFTPDSLTRNAAAATRNEKPIFIVGMYRSGTTLVEQILSSHPGIAAGGELTVWTPTDLEPDATTGHFDPDRTHAAITKYLSALQKIGPSAARVTDKLPFNCFRLGAIRALLPNARIIHCQRDPIDTCLSIYSNSFGSRLTFAARKSDLVFCYEQYLRMMDHWRKTLPPDIFLEVQYERLVTDREAETRRLIAFTGLDWIDDCLRPEQNKRAISTSSAWQARQPVYTGSMQRWRRFEPWIGELRNLYCA
jgi:tetratricopeptide (TPR) repeat protein